jgi:nicotinamide mononucleotide (NMN) deamidase PncC
VDTASYALTLNAVTLTYTPIGGPTYTLPVATAAYVKTHNNIGLSYSGAAGSSIFIGTQPVTAIYIGVVPVTKVYIGTAQVF